MKFAIEPNNNSRESLAVYSCSAKSSHVKYVISEKPIDATPIGSVEYCESFLKEIPKVEFYPRFLANYLKRDITIIYNTNEFTLRERIFLKDATKWKSGFESRIYEAGEIIQPGTYHMSEIIEIKNEWRYYIADGEIITTGWYAGENEDKPSPDLGFDFPSYYNAAVDFAETNKGIVLIESHAPYACGWYGDKHIDYLTWQHRAWRNISS